MASKPIASLNTVAQAIADKHNTQMAETYAQLREMAESGVIQEEGVQVFTQETKQGKYGTRHFFSDCDKVVTVWESLYLSEDNKSKMLLKQVVNAVGSNSKLRAQFPRSLLGDILKYISDK